MQRATDVVSYGIGSTDFVRLLRLEFAKMADDDQIGVLLRALLKKRRDFLL